MQHRDAHAVELEPLAGRRRVPGYPVGAEPIEKARCTASRLRRAPGSITSARPEPRHHGRQAAEMIGVSVGNHRAAERPRALPLEKRSHHRASRIARLRLRGRHPSGSSAPPGVRITARVALTHVQKM